MKHFSVALALAIFGALMPTFHAQAQTIDLVCNGRNHIKIDLNASTVVTGTTLHHAEITDTHVKWDYIQDVTGGEPIQGPHMFNTLDRDSGILEEHADAGRGYGPAEGVTWSGTNIAETCVRANKIF